MLKPEAPADGFRAQGPWVILRSSNLGILEIPVFNLFQQDFFCNGFFLPDHAHPSTSSTSIHNHPLDKSLISGLAGHPRLIPSRRSIFLTLRFAARILVPLTLLRLVGLVVGRFVGRIPSWQNRVPWSPKKTIGNQRFLMISHVKKSNTSDFDHLKNLSGPET